MADWLHVLQTIPLQLISAWRIETGRARKAGRSTLFACNPVLRWLLLEVGVVLCVGYVLGQWVAIAFCGQALVSIILLEYVNYIRHYGLERAVGERQTKMHSWQSKKRLSRWALIELTLHPAHHLKASDPFWKLQPYEGAPELPTGYFGLFWPSLFPPLWRRWLDPRIPE